MNEKLKQIARDSGFMPDNFISRWEDEFERLFESIVRECADIADLADENKCEWIGGNILTHFGVNE